MAAEDLLKIVNASGFLFQLRAEHEARAVMDKTGWAIHAVEHPWSSDDADRGGFIDLILRYAGGSLRLVIECKRVQDGKWIFLVPKAEHEPKPANRLLWTHKQKGRADLIGYENFLVRPMTPGSAYCVVRGTGEGDTPMLERLANLVLASADAFAKQELLSKSSWTGGELSIYIPVILTNAELFVCDFSPQDVDFATGKLPAADFKGVPFLRFEKSLLGLSEIKEDFNDAHELNQLSVATLFVVNSGALETFLSEVMLLGSPESPVNPWVYLRNSGA